MHKAVAGPNDNVVPLILIMYECRWTCTLIATIKQANLDNCRTHEHTSS